MSDDVVAKRAYRSPKRKEQAARTRERIIEAAADLFSTKGFAGATMGDIARAADVSVESVHATGTKAALLLEAFRTRYTGQGGWSSFDEVESVQDIMSGDDPDVGIDQVIDFLAMGHARSARLMTELRATAAVEPLIAEHWAELVAVKAAGWMASAEWMVRIGIARTDGAAPELSVMAASLSVMLSAETYLQLTDDWGFDDQQYREWARVELRRSVH